MNQLTLPGQIESAAEPRRASWLRRHPLLGFFALAFGLTWPLLIADALGSRGVLPFRLPLAALLFMGYAPTLAALIAARAQRPGGARALLRRLLVWRIGPSWYAIAILTPAALSVATIGLVNLLGASPAVPLLSAKFASLSAGQMAASIALLFLMSMVINGEELGWRGFALPRLQARYSALTSSVILGVVWALFHLPLFWTIGGSSQADMPLLGFLVQLGAISVLMTWVFNHTRGSVLPAILYHAAVNTWTQVFAIDHAGPLVFWAGAALSLLIAAAIVAFFGPARLGREKVVE